MRILLAEDERPLSKALVKIFEKNNYAVDAVYDGADALDYLESGCYDAAVLDIMMPKMDGITVLKTIRGKGNQIPVLMLTAKSEIEDRVTGLDSGANDYLPKPFDSRELLARLRVTLRRLSAINSSISADSSVKIKALPVVPSEKAMTTCFAMAPFLPSIYTPFPSVSFPS